MSLLKLTRCLLVLMLGGAISSTVTAQTAPETPLEQTLPPSQAAEPPPDAHSSPEPLPFSEGPFGDLMNGTVGHSLFRADYKAAWFPEEAVTGQATKLGYEEQDLRLSAPLWQEGADEWSIFTSVRSEIFQTGAILPNTGQPFPDELWNIRLGTSYRHLFDNDWVAGASLSVGSASDKPFNGLSEMTAGVNAFLRIPQGEHNAWLFTLSYSANSELPIPIPGVAYIWQPSDALRINVGLPFQVWWRPLDDLTVDASYMLLRTVHARATYRLAPPVRIYAAYDWGNESYFLADRIDNNDRFFYYDQRVTAGVKWNLSKAVMLDISGGFVFDRFYFEGQNYTDRTNNPIDVGNGPFGAAQLWIKW